MKSISLAAGLAAAFFLVPHPSSAHHGQEFFLLYDAKVQNPGHGILQGNFSFADEGTEDSISLAPSLSLGILPRAAFNLRADFSDEAGSGWAYRSIEPGLQFDLTPKGMKLPMRFGFAVTYQFSEGDDASSTHHASDLSGGSIARVHHDEPAAESGPLHHHSNTTAVPAHDHNSHDHSPPTPSQPGVDPGPDALTPEELAAMEQAANPNPTPQPTTAPAANAAASRPKRRPSKSPKPAQTSHRHHDTGHPLTGGHAHAGGIHNHTDNLFSARLIFEADLTPQTLLVANLINVIPEGGDAAWGYAIGIRQRLRPGLSVGLEALGDFDRNLHQEILGALFWEPMHHVLLKFGAGTGLSAASPDATVRAGILWMF